MIALLTYPLIHLTVLSFSKLLPESRYYLVLYPFLLLTVAIGLVQMKKKIALPILLFLLVIQTPDTLRLIRPAHLGLFTQYRGEQYLQHGLRCVNAEEVNFTNWWVKHCADNSGFRAMYGSGNSRIVDTMHCNETEADDRLRSIHLLQEGKPLPAELIAAGMVLGERYQHDPAVWRQIMQGITAPTEEVNFIQAGFQRKFVSRTMTCPGEGEDLPIPSRLQPDSF